MTDIEVTVREMTSRARDVEYRIVIAAMAWSQSRNSRAEPAAVDRLSGVVTEYEDLIAARNTAWIDNIGWNGKL